jgi:23S rRNA A2030 N6-methylase RlmJ
MKDGEMVLITPPSLKSRIDAYLEWLANELIMMANKTGS